MKYDTLKDLQKGEKAKVYSVTAEDTMRRRLQDIGLIKGTEVECLHKSPSGDPVAYWIRGAVIALRSEDSVNIKVVKQKK
jgi:ferrous iron transport protein A